MHRTTHALTIISLISLLVLSACPNTNSDVGAPCSIAIDAGPAQGVFSTAAPECSTHICLKPVDSSAASGRAAVDTGAFCTAGCSTDSDCDGVLRDPSNPNDKTCASGYTCGALFVKGALCCQKLCICKDFTGGTGMPTPTACQGAAALSCN